MENSKKLEPSTVQHIREQKDKLNEMTLSLGHMNLAFKRAEKILVERIASSEKALSDFVEAISVQAGIPPAELSQWRLNLDSGAFEPFQAQSPGSR